MQIISGMTVIFTIMAKVTVKKRTKKNGTAKGKATRKHK